MSLYISSRQYKKTDLPLRCDIPALMEFPSLRLEHRIFESEYDFSNLLLDAYQLMNPQKQEISYPVLPCGGPQIIVLFGGAVPAKAYLCGPVSRLTKLCIPGQAAVYCARFRAGSAGLFTQQEANELTDAALPLSRFSGLFTQQIQYAESFHERNVMLGRQLAAVNAQRYAPLPLVVSSVQRILDCQGRVKVTELAQAGNCSERYINRIFHMWVGLGPKHFCEMTQLHYTIHTMMRQKPKSLMQMAVTCGYYDQTHMNRTFRKFLDYTADDMRCMDGDHINLMRVPSLLEDL